MDFNAEIIGIFKVFDCKSCRYFISHDVMTYTHNSTKQTSVGDKHEIMLLEYKCTI